MLDADIRLRLDRLSLDAMLRVGRGEVVALLGPNGAGKSTVLRAMAGLLRLSAGRVELDGVVLELEGGGTLVTGGTAAGGTAVGGTAAVSGTGAALAMILPSAVAVDRQRPQADVANLWQGRVGAVDLLGDRVRVGGRPPITAEVMPSAVDELKLDDGGELWVSVRPSAITAYPP